MIAIISIAIILVLLYLAYKVIRFVTKNFITAEVKNESSKFTIKIKDWFVWNVQINNEKGTAGGNIKINFPIKSALLIAIVCIAIAIVANKTGVSLIVSLVFLSFAVYHLKKWAKSFKFISAHEALDDVKKISRSANNKYIGGVCSGISQHYSSSVFITRLIFIALALFGGIGVYIYLLLWYILPFDNTSAILK